MAGPPSRNTPKPFVTQPQGGAPPRANVGTENSPLIHPFPGQPVDPRIFVGPHPALEARQGGSTPAGFDARTGAAVQAQQAQQGQQLSVPAGAPQAAVMQQQMHGLDGIELLRRSPSFPVDQMPGAPGHPAFGYTRLDGYFLSRLPAAGLTYWHRKRVVAGTTAFASVNSTYTLPMYQLQQGLSLVVFSIVQNWYDSNLDPLDPDALTAFQADQDTYGRVGINLLVNNAPVFDAFETLYDPNNGTPTVREQSGFTALNTNLLYVGNHPTAVYVRDNATVQVRYTVSDTLPGHVPAAVGVEMRGYVLPTKSFQELLISVRNQW